MAVKDYYETLGVQREADDKQLRKAFRRMARKYHPDLNPGNKAAEQRFKEINEAYGILSDPQKRTRYDTYGHQAFQPGFEEFRRQRTASAGPGFDFSSASGEGAEDFSSIFDNIFGDMLGRRPGARRGERAETLSVKGEDAEYPLEIDMEDAARGLTREIALQRHGKIERVSAKIPPGVADGTRVRLAGMGHPGRGGGKPGDLYVVTKIRPHRFFERKGDDLHLEVPITVAEAALGARIEVPTLQGTAAMTIPRATQSGQIFRLKGKGIPHLKGGGSGDQYLRMKIVLPGTIRNQDDDLFRRIGNLYSENPRDHLKKS